MSVRLKFLGCAVLAWFPLVAACEARAEAAFAFAQGSGGGWAGGGIYNSPSSFEAENVAMQRCEQRAMRERLPTSNCKILTTFNNACFAIAVQNVGNGFGSITRDTLAEARRDALSACAKMDRPCSIQMSFCDIRKELVEIVVCIQPVFKEERKLQAQILENPDRVTEVTEAIKYLRAKYCRTIEGTLTADSTEHVGDNCYQSAGIFRGERVYWGRCQE